MPFLVGFEYRRPDTQGEQTANIIDEEETAFIAIPSLSCTRGGRSTASG